ncbi:cytochrome P450 [Colletotrichum tabaci]|uniref:Cytochrome P450 n=1 Tax=Colletotrichum tabaci TaxID=1209068 RepID=A0AAV9TPX6_9PEZI
MTEPVFVAAVAAVVAVLLRIAYLQLLPKPIPGVPHNKDSAGRLLGDAPYFKQYEKAARFRTRFFYDLVSKHKSPLAQFFPGPFARPFLVLADYREAQRLMSKQSKDLSRGFLNNVVWSFFLPNHFIAMEDSHPSFKKSKFLTKDLMTNNFLHTVSAPASHQAVSNFVKLWKQKAAIAQGLPFETTRDLEGLTYDIMMTAIFGKGEGEGMTMQQSQALLNDKIKTDGTAKVALFPPAADPEILQAHHDLNVSITGAFGSLFPRVFFFFENFRPRTRRALATKRDFVQAEISRSVAQLTANSPGGKPGNQLASAADYVISRERAAAETEGRLPVYDSMELNDMLWGYFGGGQDSTHSTLCFTVKYLGMHQGAQSELRRALRQAHHEAHTREPTVQEIIRTQVPYLDAFIEETLRLCSPAGAITKETACDTIVSGHAIPKGTPIMILLTGPTFTQPGVRPPEKLSEGGVSDWSYSEYPVEGFHPERWLRSDENGDVRYDNNAGPFLSFSTGPRGCWGKRLAYLELKLIVTLLVWNFEFLRLPAELDDDGLTEGLFTKPKSSLVSLKAITG